MEYKSHCISEEMQVLQWERKMKLLLKYYSIMTMYFIDLPLCARHVPDAGDTKNHK